MILLRNEVELIGPDNYEADEGSSEIWSKEEKAALFIYKAELQRFIDNLRVQLPDLFDVEVR